MEAEIIVPGEDESAQGALTILDDLPEDPQERAEARLTRLKATFASTLAIIAAMYEDRDWEHLTRADGTPYASMAEVLSDTLEVSLSMARRYVQGARDFYLPLSQLVVDGTRIEITSGEVASLGKDGLADAVDRATQNLADVDDPESASEVIDDSVKWAKERKEGKKAQEAEGDDWEPEGEDWGGYGEDPSKPGAGAHTASADGIGFAEDEDDLMDDLPTPGAAGAAGAFVDDEDDTDTEDEDEAGGPIQDPISAVLDDAATYDTDEDREQLPDQLREVYAAMQTLATMDPDAVSALVDYETRGFMIPLNEAIDRTARMRALIETSPWLMSKMAL